ncbi:MAG: zinc-binding alcohol dehydrogenase [Alphaproteobacteria bacterium]|nr:zinc-binding alcohol dehydrogenase [Alphaproteobacteria bacterium]
MTTPANESVRTSKRPSAARAFWITRPGHAEIRTEPIPDIPEEYLLIRATHGAISKGTESLIFRGKVPSKMVDRMRCPFQTGDFPGPVKYGYSTVGTVIDGPGARIGQSVFCLYPHQDFFTIPAAAAHGLPKGLPPSRAVLAANMETALNALWDAGIRRGDQVCVIGAGVVGLLTAYLARRVGRARVDLLDIDPSKAAAARAVGATFQERPPSNANYSTVIHASGAPAGLATALKITGFEGKIIELSWYGTQPVTLNLGEDFHDRRLTIRSSQVGSVATSRRQGWTHARRLDKALELLRDPCLDVLISGESDFEELPGTMAALADGRLSALCHRIIYR